MFNAKSGVFAISNAYCLILVVTDWYLFALVVRYGIINVWLLQEKINYIISTLRRR